LGCAGFHAVDSHGLPFNRQFGLLADPAGRATDYFVVFLMNKSVMVEALLLSERNNSLIRLKLVNTKKPLIGVVQKILNQVIILKSASNEHVTLTFSNIEAIDTIDSVSFRHFIHNFIRTLHSRLRQVPS
jgi:hypothetical protein